ncbi:zingipain-1-like isoform X2 [Zingiber officinale]|uniref:zingipain-1-like isoform X2 n=1 Tax=Zingiber officinale TaxID=94328 RepID=UPI001C4D69D4|nr:zingipain-1-like isoform X2 [Zingiber officinale]
MGQVKDEMELLGVSAIAVVEGINKIITGNLISLSEQQLVDCDANKDACNGGLMDVAFEYIIGNPVVSSEKAQPYTGKQGTCKKEI